MKREERTKLNATSAADLQSAVATCRDTLWRIKGELAAGKVKNVREIRNVRRNVARLLTALAGKENHA